MARTPTSATGSSTSSHPLRRRAGRGLTLIELLVVMAIMVIVAGALGPSLMGTLGASRLKASARDLLSHCRYARDLAVRRNTYTRVTLDTATRSHRVVVLVTPDQAANANLKQPEWSEETGNLGAPRQLQDGVTYDKLVSKDPTGVTDLTFQPDGEGVEWFASVKDDKGRRLAVHVTGTTGLGEILSPSDSEAFQRLDQEGQSLP